MLTVAKICTGPCKQYSNRICMVAIKRVAQTKKIRSFKNFTGPVHTWSQCHRVMERNPKN